MPTSELNRRERQIIDLLYQYGKSNASEGSGSDGCAPGYSAVRTMERIAVLISFLLAVTYGMLVAPLKAEPVRAGLLVRDAFRPPRDRGLNQQNHPKRVLLAQVRKAAAEPPRTAPEAPLAFEAASIRPSTFPSGAFGAGFLMSSESEQCAGGTISISGTRVSIERVSICEIIRIAYDLKGYQVFGAPTAPAISLQEALALGDKPAPQFFYDIEARAPGTGAPSQEQVREMLRGLLADRFGLKSHRESRDLAYYALVPGKNGPRITPAREDCKPSPGPSADVSGLTATRFRKLCNQSMAQVVRSLAGSDRPVVDMTGVTGKFQYEYHYEIDRSDRRHFAEAQKSARMEALGLRLEPRKGPVDVLMVDHVGPPSAN